MLFKTTHTIFMKKKSKVRPRSKLIEASFKKRIFDYYFEEMEEKTEEYNKSHNSNVNFMLAQSTNKSDLINKVLDLSYFYDKNFTGNKDFMHIPSFSQVANNVIKFPVMLATQKLEDGSEDIIGATTVKYEMHSYISENPYFPTCGETILSITGVLSKSNSMCENNQRVRGIGKELYKSAIRAAIKLNKDKKVRLVCEIDCRNEKSLSAITKAVSDLQKENYEICSYITGYYEIYNDKNKLAEAPTFMLEVDLNANKYAKTSAKFSYVNCKTSKLNSELLKVIKDNTKEKNRFLNIIKDNKVIYHSISPINTQNIEINPGTTANGNERKPSLNPVLEYVMAKKSKTDSTNGLALAE